MARTLRDSILLVTAVFAVHARDLGHVATGDGKPRSGATSGRETSKVSS
ncbi:MAG: hypothetical protein WD825_04765 [Gemmatimonadaceae bacterium]